MITPEEVLLGMDEEIHIIKNKIIVEIDDFIKVRGKQLKDMQIIQYEIDYQMSLIDGDTFFERYSRLRTYIIDELITDYTDAGWVIWDDEPNGQKVLNFATEKIMKHRESESDGRGARGAR